MKKVILDCDPGMDDSMAIVLACKSQALEVKAITTVNGNYPVDVTSVNALKMLELLGRTQIPVCRGMDRPMIRKSPKDPFTHGEDGQGNANLPAPVTAISKTHAVEMIINLVKQNPNEITIIGTGPLTNIAMAIAQAPEIKPLIKEIVAISGAFGLNKFAFLNATGDTPQSEWNVYVDPEAADLVYSSGIPFTAIGLDVATFFSVDFSEGDIAQLKTSKNREAWFLSNAIDFVRRRGFDAYCAIIDCMAVGYVVDPGLIATRESYVGVETKDGLTLGMTVRDGRHHHVWTHLPYIRIAVDADYGRFLSLLKNLVLA